MAGGLMQLVAIGAQDAYLTGSPQITFFKVVYRRHTNFSMETIEQPFETAKFGTRTSLVIQRNGDLITQMCIKLTLPNITCEQVDKQCGVAWVRRVGHALIKDVEILIGGSRIDHYSGVWLDIWYELTHSVAQERGYRQLIGDTDELTTIKERTDKCNDSDILLEGQTIYIPLIFWFNKISGLALPVIALQFHEIRINIELEDITKLIIWKGKRPPRLSNLGFKDASLLVDYIYLDTDERSRFAKVGHEYLIEQVQFNGEESLSGTSGSLYNDQKYKLNFNHPTKELILALKVGAYNGEGNKTSFCGSRGRFLTYTNHDDKWAWHRALDVAAANIVKGMFWFSEQEPRNIGSSVNADDLFNLTQTIRDYGVCVESCDDKNLRLDLPGGKVFNVQLVNRTKDDNNTKVSGDYGQQNNLYGGGDNNNDQIGGDSLPQMYILLNNVAIVRDNYDLSAFIHEADIEIGIYRGPNGSYRAEVDKCVVSNMHGRKQHALTLEDVSIPVGDWKSDNRYTSTTSGTKHSNPHDFVVTQPCNYGVRLDGAGNPLASAVIQLNGHERFKEQLGSYFNYLLPFRHHTRTPADGVNVYSFALEPEKHQPSGSANLSRIDSVLFAAKFKDPFRGGKPMPQLDLVKDTKVYLFCLSYNVLRIMSGIFLLLSQNK
jgi:hypothetical protein